MKTSDFDFDLPKEFIAQSPVTPRDSSKLLVFDTKKDKISHHKFSDIRRFLDKNDTLVLNKTKVFPARIVFEFLGKVNEIFLLERISEDSFLVLVKPGKRFLISNKFRINENLSFEVSFVNDDGSRIIKFFYKNDNLIELLHSVGQIPFPPYIKQADKYKENYQTVFCDDKFCNSVAAPTAGLHFTNSLISDLKEAGVDFVEIVLNVGRGTFMPVKVDDLEKHVMHYEEYFISQESAEKLNSNLLRKSRIIGVGTTSIRTLESAYDNGFFESSSKTDLFIYPGKHKWNVVDGIITNFHLPKSSLLMLVSAFLEYKGVKNPVNRLLEIYEIAKKENYRFYSFGDSMFIF